jgi:hypothetical protein
MDRPEPIKGSRKPAPQKAVKLLDDDEVERMLAEADDEEEAEEDE